MCIRDSFSQAETNLINSLSPAAIAGSVSDTIISLFGHRSCLRLQRTSCSDSLPGQLVLFERKQTTRPMVLYRVRPSISSYFRPYISIIALELIKDRRNKLVFQWKKTYNALVLLKQARRERRILDGLRTLQSVTSTAMASLMWQRRRVGTLELSRCWHVVTARLVPMPPVRACMQAVTQMVTAGAGNLDVRV